MPFLSAPLIWGRLSNFSKRSVNTVERAHGDGHHINLDAPEAFDEVFWKNFWPEKYLTDNIQLWEKNETDAANFLKFFEIQMSKVVYLRNKNKNYNNFYISKNNLNIARLPFLLNIFENKEILVIVRDPISHANSLLRQHKRFAALQKNDKFMTRYMRDIGHFEFGLIHKPICFEKFDSKLYDINTPNYWLHYWNSAHRKVLEYKNECTFLLLEDLAKNPNKKMSSLINQLELQDYSVDFSKFFKFAKGNDNGVFDQKLLNESEEIYNGLVLQAWL